MAHHKPLCPLYGGVVLPDSFILFISGVMLHSFRGSGQATRPLAQSAQCVGRIPLKKLPYLRVSGVERYVERCRVALPVLGKIEQQFVPAALEDTVFAVR